MWDDLPSEVVVRILLNLPVKDVIRSTLINKSIYSLVHSKFFINTYNQHSLLYGINPPLIILRFLGCMTYQPKFSLRYCNSELDEYMPIDFPFEDEGLRFHVSNCCNSLVCLSCFNSKPFFLWNPYIGKTLALPNQNSTSNVFDLLGLGFVNETSDYKVLFLNSIYPAELYSLQRNSWKNLALPDNFVKPNFCSFTWNIPVYVKGSLYWMGEANVVGVFDFKDEVFSNIRLPDGWDSTSPLAFDLRKHTESSIAVIRRDTITGTSPVFHIQVMDVNEKKWKKYSRVSTPSGRVTSILGFNKEGYEIVEWEDYKYNGEHIMGIGVIVNGKCKKVGKEAHHHIDVSNNYVCNLALLDISGENHPSTTNQIDAKRIEDV